jgi:hypothetical protein
MLLTKKVIKDKKSHAQIRSVIFLYPQNNNNKKEKEMACFKKKVN